MRKPFFSSRSFPHRFWHRAIRPALLGAALAFAALPALPAGAAPREAPAPYCTGGAPPTCTREACGGTPVRCVCTAWACPRHGEDRPTVPAWLAGSRSG